GSRIDRRRAALLGNADSRQARAGCRTPRCGTANCRAGEGGDSMKRITLSLLLLVALPVTGCREAARAESRAKEPAGEHATHAETADPVPAGHDMANMTGDAPAAVVRVEPSAGKALGIRTVPARGGALSTRRGSP